MKVLLVNGSIHTKGCTYTALNEAAKVLNDLDIETEIIQLGPTAFQDCIACGSCKKTGKCAFDNDCVNETIEKAKTSDGFVFGTPVYYAHPSGRILSFLDRVFYAGSANFQHKPGFAIASARRAGTIASFDVLNKYFTISQMPIVASTYWNEVHGSCAEDVLQDLEGMQTVRNAARNMAWLLKCIEAGRKEGITPPEAERQVRTNFIR